MRLNREIRLIIKRALREDIGREDITTLLAIPYHFKMRGTILAKEKGILCGIDIAKSVFKERSRTIKFKALKSEGEKFSAGERIALVEGDARLILSCERVALNFLSLLSGVATLTYEFVKRTKGTPAKILDTRKTTPNLRILEKYAVRIGGGYNHRYSLQEAILIKDNHLRAGRFIHKGQIDQQRLSKCISYLRTFSGIKIEIEVEDFEEFKKVIAYKPDIVMLDNFSLSEIEKAVRYRDLYFPKVKLEVSGGVSLVNVRRISHTGVDFISVGALTHSPKAIDFSLEVL